MTRPVHVLFFGVEDFLHGVPHDCHKNANNTVPIQVAPFQSEAMHMPISLGRPGRRLQLLRDGPSRLVLIGGSCRLLSASTFGRKFGTFHRLHQF